MADEKEKKLKEINDELKGLASRLFDIANSLAGDGYGNSAIFLHEAANNIWTAQKALAGQKQDVPMEFVAKSLGLDLGKFVKDVNSLFNGVRKEKEDETKKTSKQT